MQEKVLFSRFYYYFLIGISISKYLSYLMIAEIYHKFFMQIVNSQNSNGVIFLENINSQPEAAADIRT